MDYQFKSEQPLRTTELRVIIFTEVLVRHNIQQDSLLNQTARNII